MASCWVFAAFCAIWLPLSLQQVVPAGLPNTAYCHVSQEDLRVLPSAGFYRDPQSPFTSTTTTNGAPAPSVAGLGNCLFQSFDPAFDAIIGNNRTIYRVGPSNPGFPLVIESPAYLADTDEIIFSSFGIATPSIVTRVSLETGEFTNVTITPSIGHSAGATHYFDGQVVFASWGTPDSDANAPGLYLVDPQAGNSTILVNNYFGIRFNGIDDLQALSDGSIIFTDTNYSSVIPNYPPYKNAAKMPNDVWILPPNGPPRVLIDRMFNCPNGVAVSPDEKTLYISVGALTVMDSFASLQTDTVYAYDLVDTSGGKFAQNQRVFAKTDKGFVDGFEIDSQGHLIGSTGDGVAIWSPGGTLLGKIIIPPTQMVSGEPVTAIVLAGDRLIMQRLSEVLMLPVNTSAITRETGA